MINMDSKSPVPVSNECKEHGRLLRQARIDAGKTLCDVASSAFIDLVTASAIERGRLPNLYIDPADWARCK